MELHHLALGARDVARIAAFYRDLFDLPEIRRHHHPDGSLRSVWLGLDGGALMIETVDATAATETARGGLFLVAFRVTERERAAVEARLVASGHPIEARTEHTSYARDPEGNRVAISTHPLTS